MSDTLRARMRSPLAPRAIPLLALFACSTPFSVHAADDLSYERDAHPVPAAQADARKRLSTPANAREDDVITITAPEASPLIVMVSPKKPFQPVPASDGADYLKTIPGFALIRNGGTNGDPIFRGMFGSRLRMLVDGGEMLGACSSRMDTPSAYISPESFDVMTLIKGPQTVLWGPSASAGTLRFERVQPRFNEQGMTLRSNMLAGSSGRLDQNIDTTFGNPFGYLRLIGNVSRAGDYQDGDGRRVYSEWRKWNSDLAFGFIPSADMLMELTVGRGDGYAHYAGRGMDGTRFRRESVGGRLEKNAIGDVLESIEVQGWYHYADHVMDNYSRQMTYPGSRPISNWVPMRSNVDRLTLGGRGISTWQWRDVQLQGGADLQVNRHQKNIGGHWQEDAHFRDGGIFVEANWQFRPVDTLISGMRLEHTVAQYNAVRGIERRSETYPASFIRLEHKATILPLMAYAGVGINERFPDYWELITLKSGRDSGQDAFHRLKREKTAQLDLGAHLQLERLNGWISAYTGHVKDFILFRYDVPCPNANRAENIDARILGGEAGMGYLFSDHWRLESSLAWAFGKNQDTHQPLPQIPPLEGQLALIWEKGSWSAAALWRLVAAQHHVALNEGNVVGKDFSRSTGFGVLSTNLAWQAATKINISAGVDNLFNRRYSEHLNLAGNREFGYSSDVPLVEPGRTLWARAGIAF